MNVCFLYNIYSSGDFTAIVELHEGRHEYKFFVDGQWLHDPNEVYIYTHTLSLTFLLGWCHVYGVDLGVFGQWAGHLQQCGHCHQERL